MYTIQDAVLAFLLRIGLDLYGIECKPVSNILSKYANPFLIYLLPWVDGFIKDDVGKRDIDRNLSSMAACHYALVL